MSFQGFLSRAFLAIRRAAAWTGALLLVLARRTRAGLVRVRASTRLDRARRWLARTTESALRIGFWSGLATALVLFTITFLAQRIPPASIGVLETQWGGGIVARDYGPGVHWSLRGWHAWHVLDGRTHFAFFGAPAEGAEFPILDLRTKEGNEIRVSVMVPYRIVPGEGHLLVRDGLRNTYARLVSATIKDVLMQDLAELTANEFASTEARTARMRTTLPRLNQLLERYHVRAETIEIHQVLFWTQYEQILQLKQLTRQKALLAKAATLVEQEMRKNTLEQDIAGAEMRIKGEMGKEIETVRSSGKLAISRVRAEASEYDRTRRTTAQAEYDRLVAEADQRIYDAESLKERLTNAAFDSPGGRIDLARQGAANLRFKEVVLNANDPRSPSVLDLEKLAELLLGKPASTAK